MRNLVLGLFGIFLFMTVFFMGAYGQVKSRKPNPLKIELGQQFQNDQVKIFLDKKLVYHKQLTTQASERITDEFFLPKPKKPFTLTVEINGEKFEKSSPKGEKEMDQEDYSLLIDYDRAAEEVEIKTKIVIVLYD